MGSELSSPVGSWADAADGAATTLRAADRWREIRTLGSGGVRTTLPDGRAVTHFASNDYLGLSAHPAVVAAAVAATERYGAGSGASRLVVGSRPPHDELEAALARWKRQQAALLFPTGYAANLGVLGALARLGGAGSSPVAVVSDELNHASIIDGARLARVEVEVYRHADADAAADAVARLRADGRRCVVVTDSVFSMDGDVAPLPELAALCAATGSLLVVDDAHAVFAGCGADALGDAGATTDGAEVLVVGTLSKVLGGLGGFVAGSQPLVDWCRNASRSFIFSTASPPAVAAAALAALDVLASDEGARLVESLRANVDVVRPDHPSAVVPIVLGEERRALDVSAALLDAGFLVPAIRPPTVAAGSSRLRVALSAQHTTADVAALVDALDALGVDVGPTEEGSWGRS